MARKGDAESVRMVDCHVHVFDPARFPYAPDTHYAPAGQELGTPARVCATLPRVSIPDTIRNLPAAAARTVTIRHVAG
jgi:hypothetical protein